MAWAKSMGGADREEGWGLAVDNLGSVICTGYFNGLFDADPGPNLAPLTSEGDVDAFITKLDPGGGFLWTIQIGNVQADEGYAVATDASDNIYATGIFAGIIDFDPGPGTNELTSGFDGIASDVFVLKVDAGGDHVWAVNFGGAATARGQAIATDVEHVYIAGYFNGTVDFDPSPDVAELISFEGPDVFVVKMTLAGEFVWARQLGGTGNDQAEEIAIAPNGDVVLTGKFTGTADFDPGAGEYPLTGDQDVYVAKLDAAGNFVWARQFTGPGVDDAFGVALDGASNVYTTGYFRITTDFDPSDEGVYEMASATGNFERQAFVCKLDAAGDFVWAKSLGVSPTQEGQAIAVDPGGNVYSTGQSFGGDFDPGPGEYNLGGAIQDHGVYLSKLDPDGNFTWAVLLGPSGGIGYALQVDGLGNVYATGYFEGTVDFDPGAGTQQLSVVDDRDVFVCKFTQEAVGIVEGQERSPVLLHPNPAHGALVLDGARVAERYAIIDAQGRTVLTGTTHAARLTLDVSTWTPGMYAVVFADRPPAACVARFVVDE